MKKTILTTTLALGLGVGGFTAADLGIAGTGDGQIVGQDVLVGRAVGVAAGFAFAVSLGEFGATVFIARAETITVPVAILRLLGRPGPSNFGQAMALAITVGCSASAWKSPTLLKKTLNATVQPMISEAKIPSHEMIQLNVLLRLKNSTIRKKASSGPAGISQVTAAARRITPSSSATGCGNRNRGEATPVADASWLSAGSMAEPFP